MRPWRWVVLLGLGTWAMAPWGGLTAGDPVQPWRFRGGLAVGACAAQVHGDGVSGFNKLGLTAGPWVQVRVHPNRGWELGMVWTQKGSRRVPNPRSGDYFTWRYRFTYLDLPVSYVQDVGDWGWFSGGIQASYLLSAEEDFNQTGYAPLSYLRLNPWDLGGTLGAGVHVAPQWDFSVRLSQSLLPISPRPDQPIIQWDNFMMNLAVQAMLSWNLKPSD